MGEKESEQRASPQRWSIEYANKNWQPGAPVVCGKGRSPASAVTTISGCGGGITGWAGAGRGLGKGFAQPRGSSLRS
jgi:hypothetical protein